MAFEFKVLLGPVIAVYNAVTASKRNEKQKLNEKISRLKAMLETYVNCMDGHWGSIRVGDSDVLRMSTDLQEHHREYTYITNDILFWKFSGGLDLKAQVLEFHTEYSKLTTVQPSKEIYKAKHDFAREKALKIVNDLIYRLQD